LAHARLTIIGCGNPVRSDDGAGVAVLQALRGHALPADVALVDAGTSGLEVMFQVRGARRVIIVDACRSGSEPGAVFRLPGREAMTPAAPAFSLHGLRWDHALHAGCRLFGDSFVDRVEVLLIETASLDFGLDLSAPVKGAVDKTVQLLLQEAARDD
jgi:hydrogenase maturation protease